MNDPCPKERRRLLELISSIARRAPLSPAQRERLERASRILRKSNWTTKKGGRKTFAAVGDIAKVVLEVLAESSE